MAQFFGEPVVVVSAETMDGTLTPLEKRINDVFAGVNAIDRRKIQKWYGTKLQCVRCGLDYRMLTSMGRWECHQHACDAEVLPDRSDVMWPCCQKSGSDAPGCVRADHTTWTYPYAAVHDIKMGKHLSNRLIKLQAGLYVVDKKDDKGQTVTYVQRHDLPYASWLATRALDSE